MKGAQRKSKQKEEAARTEALASLINAATSDDDLKLVRPRELEQLIGITKPTLAEWRRTGVIEQPRRFGPRLIGWSRASIRQWFLARPKA